MEKNDFTPAIVGTDWRSIKRAKEAWEKFTGIASDLYDWVFAYTEKEDLPVEKFLSLVTGEKTLKLVAKLLEFSGKAPKGFEPEMLIEKKLFRIEYQEQVIQALRDFNEAKFNAEFSFPYKIEKLFKDQFFDLDENFEKALQNHFTVFTKSEQETQALEKLNELCESLNWFADAGIARPKYGRQGLQTLLLAVGLNENKTKYAPDRNFFGSLRWKKSFK